MSLLDFLIQEYQKAGLRNRSACIKYSFKVSNTTINAYFDCYDKDIPALSLILIFKPDYYLKSFNPNLDGGVFNERYLENVPKGILEDILVDDQLSVFYEEVGKAIREIPYVMCNYEKDGYFKNTRKYQKEDEDTIKSFFYHLRKVPMSDERLEDLHAHLNISKERLRGVQKLGFNVVTTNDPVKRKLFVDEWERINEK
ncbi:hypothetical protein [Bacillus mycoides]|uniref:hypothetical protein n=1 Tax=Bacillus mycoides TaxID=1405 RepID=UPI003CF22B3C